MAQNENQPKKDWKTMISPQYWKTNVSMLFREQGSAVIPSLQNVSFTKASETIARQVKESAKELGGLFSAEECPQEEPKEAPWEVLTPKEKPFAEEIKERMLKMTRDCCQSRKDREEVFLSLSSLNDTGFRWLGDSEKMRQAMAALEKDAKLSELRAGLVPKRMSEENFWRQYFYLVERVKKAVVTSSQFGLFDDWENWDDTVVDTGNQTVTRNEDNSDLDNEVDQILNDALGRRD